jgi:hypothetical protein
MEAPIVVTEPDVKEPNLLLRLLRKFSERVVSLGTRVSRIENAAPPPTIGQIKRELEASGSHPLYVGNLLGQLAEPQSASASIYPSDPSGQVLQSLRDSQLLLVGSTSTGFALKVVRGGNPNTLYTLVSGLSTGNFMTLDTAQTSTGDKTLQGAWSFKAPTLLATSAAVTSTARAAAHVVGPGGPVASFPTIAANTALVVESNSVTNFTAVVVPANGLGVWSVYQSGSTAASGFLVYNTGAAGGAGQWSFVGNGGTAVPLNFSTQAFDIAYKVTSYNGDTLSTSGNGVPSIVARAAVIGASSSTVTNLWTPPVAGEYRLNIYTQTGSTGGGSAVYTYGWNDTGGGHGTTLAAMPLTANNAASASVIIHAATSGSILYTIDAATSGTYTAFSVLERLS